MSSLNLPDFRIAGSHRGQTHIKRRRVACRAQVIAPPRVSGRTHPPFPRHGFEQQRQRLGITPQRDRDCRRRRHDRIRYVPRSRHQPDHAHDRRAHDWREPEDCGARRVHLTISGNESSTVFAVSTGENVTISGLTIAGGVSGVTGGGVANRGDLKLLDDVLSDNSAKSGGAVYNSTGSLSLTGCTIESNQASDSGFGGGIFVSAGFVTIEDSTFQGNSAGAGGGHSSTREARSRSSTRRSRPTARSTVVQSTTRAMQS